MLVSGPDSSDGREHRCWPENRLFGRLGASMLVGGLAGGLERLFRGLISLSLREAKIP